MRKKIVAFVFAAALLMAVAVGVPALVGNGPAQAKATVVTTQEKVPLDMSVFVSCARDGAGENVQLSGTLHIVSRAVDDGSGGFHVSSHSNPQGVSGVGLISGDKYQGTGVTRNNVNFKPPFPSESTYVNNFRIIGQGPGNNYLVHETIHMTVNANGEVTADVVNTSVDCK